MIHYLEGKIESREEKFLVIGVAGIGYRVFCSPNTLDKVSVGQVARVFTSLHLKEDAAELYGFLTSGELGLFNVLSGISGVGPKTAVMLASLGSLEKLKEIMEKGSLPREIKGIGRKRMQKILLELTGKIKEVRQPDKKLSDDGTLEVLVSLGFPKQKARDTLSDIPDELSREERVKRALKILGRSA